MAKRKATTALAVTEAPTATMAYFKSLEEQFVGMTLEEHGEAIYNDNLNTFLNTITHIQLVHSHEKYKQKYKTIEDWAIEEFGWNRQRIYEYLQAYNVIVILQGINCELLPANDYQARQLSKLDVDDVRDAWSMVENEVKSGKKLTGTLVQQAVKLIKTEGFEEAQVEDISAKKAKPQKKTDEELAAELFDTEGNIIPDKPVKGVYETETDKEADRKEFMIVARRFKALMKEAGFTDIEEMRSITLLLLEIIAD